MAVQTYQSIPKVLPSPESAVNAVAEMLRQKIPMFGDKSIIEMFPMTLDVSRAWITGSRVWMPAVMGKPIDDTKDIDIIFADQGAAEEFTGYIVEQVKVAVGYDLLHKIKNTFDGSKIIDLMTGRSILDAWDLDPGQSIAEHVSGFKWEHERVAVCVGACPGEIGALTRIVKPSKYGDREYDKKVIRQERDTYGS